MFTDDLLRPRGPRVLSVSGLTSEAWRQYVSMDVGLTGGPVEPYFWHSCGFSVEPRGRGLQGSQTSEEISVSVKTQRSPLCAEVSVRVSMLYVILYISVYIYVYDNKLLSCVWLAGCLMSS